MPIPRYTPGSMNLGAANSIPDAIGGAYNNVVDTVSHPKDALMNMLGMGHQSPPQQGPTMVDEANQTFIKPTPNPVVAPPRRKPMVNTGGF